MQPSHLLRSITRRCQRGVAAVEFALVMLFVLGPVMAFTIEIGRIMYLYNTLEEVTRRAARNATVNWVDKTDTIIQDALFGGDSLPAGAEVTKDNVLIEYLDASYNPVTKSPDNPGDNLSACADSARTTECIYAVRVSLVDVTYEPMFLRFAGFSSINMGSHTVVMHAESLGFND